MDMSFQNCCNCDNECVFLEYYYVCTTCGVVQDYIHFIPERGLNLYYPIPYKCSAYFKRILRCLQDKCLSVINTEILYLIKKHHDMTPREVLKKYKLFHMYIHLPQIERLINKKQPINLTQNEERILNIYFDEIVDKLRRFYPERKQILRYKQILKILFKKIGRDDLAQLIPDLKSKKAITDFNIIWSSIN